MVHQTDYKQMLNHWYKEPNPIIQEISQLNVEKRPCQTQSMTDINLNSRICVNDFFFSLKLEISYMNQDKAHYIFIGSRQNACKH